MKIKLSQIMEINIDDDKLVSWEHDRKNGVYTLVFTDGSTWKYEYGNEFKKFYMVK